MMTFVTVVLAILVANVLFGAGMIALMFSKKFQCKMIDFYAKWAEWYVKMLEKKFEEGL